MECRSQTALWEAASARGAGISGRAGGPRTAAEGARGLPQSPGSRCLVGRGFRSIRRHCIFSSEMPFWYGMRLKHVHVLELLFSHNWTFLLLAAFWELWVSYGKTKQPTSCCPQLHAVHFSFKRLCASQTCLAMTVSTLCRSFVLTNALLLPAVCGADCCATGGNGDGCAGAIR